MPTPLLNRLGSWLGCWRGASALPDGRAGVFEITITSHFDGNVLQVEACSWIPDGGLVSHGIGLWSLAESGRLVNATWIDRWGHCVLDETPDDPDVLSMEGPFSGNLRLSVSFRLEDGALLMSSAVGEGYAGGRQPRTWARMTRIATQRAADA
jgi:hypothetical protein